MWNLPGLQLKEIILRFICLLLGPPAVSGIDYLNFLILNLYLLVKLMKLLLWCCILMSYMTVCYCFCDWIWKLFVIEGLDVICISCMRPSVGCMCLNLSRLFPYFQFWNLRSIAFTTPVSIWKSGIFNIHLKVTSHCLYWKVYSNRLIYFFLWKSLCVDLYTSKSIF